MPEMEVCPVVVIGSGPAAWTAAVYAARAELSPLVFEGEPSREMIPGGQLMLTTEVENFPSYPDGISGQDLMDRMRAQALRFGTRAVMENVVRVDTSVYPYVVYPSYSEPVQARSIIVATGARANWLGLDNELRLVVSGGGVTACATCDGAMPAYRDQVLAVVGGGDTACEEALFLTRYGKEVVLIHRRTELRASRIMAERVLSHPKIRVLWNSEVSDVLGADFVEGLALRNTVTGEHSTLECRGLFVAIGHTPNTAFLDGALRLKPNGYIWVEPGSTRTSVPGIFACGDVADDQFRQAITAAGKGCQSALEASHWLDSLVD